MNFRSSLRVMMLRVRISPVSGHLYLMGTADCSLGYVY